MPKTLFAVVQEGGSSGEAYAALYGGPVVADKAARSHRHASYRSTPPIGFEILKEDTKAGTITINASDLIELLENIRIAEYT
jgi:hypothetical protein